MDVRTGNFSLSRAVRDGLQDQRLAGRRELVLEGRDFPRITRAAGRITTLSVGNVGFALSREQRPGGEDEAQTQAIENFKRKAAELAKDFGFGGHYAGCRSTRTRAARSARA